MPLPHSPIIYFAAAIALGLLMVAGRILWMIWYKPKPHIGWPDDIALHPQPWPSLQTGGLMVKVMANVADFQRSMDSINKAMKVGAKQWRRLAIQLGPKWLDQDPPRWLWPFFSPSPRRPFDWRID